MRAELTVPMLLVTHDPLEVEALCDEVVVLADGRLVAQGEPRRVLTDPAIFPLADREQYENLLPGRLLDRRAGVSRVRLGAGPEALELVVLDDGDAAAGDEVLVGLPADDILLAAEPPRGLSARNVLPATVTAIRSAATATLVEVRLAADLPPLSVRVTEGRPADLGLAPGRPVHLIVKAASCRLYGGGG